MTIVGLKTLKNKLSEYVRRAGAGETIVITDRGRAVAEIIRAQEVPERYKDHPVLARGIREGWITPARNPGAPLPPRKPIAGYTLEQLLTDLDRDREDR
jgi:prevent-host-death family protein